MSLIINETTTSAEIASIDQKIPLEEVYQQTQLPSLARSIFQKIPIKSPTNGIFNLTDDHNNNNEDVLQLVRANLNVYDDLKPIKTSLTQEASQDLERMYGEKTAKDYIAKMLRARANIRENEKALEFLQKECATSEDLILTDKLNSETRMFEITNKVQTLVLDMNSKSLRTFSAFAIIPFKYVSSIMTTYAYTTGLDTTVNSELLVANFGFMKYYVNPNRDDNYAYVGLKSNTNASCASAFFGDYQNQLQTVTNPSSGELNYFLYNRFAICASPLHTEENPMLYKFKILEN